MVGISTKRSKDEGIFFVGNNASDVTGSCIYINYNGKKILLECGLVQCNDYLENYKANSKKFSFSPKEIDYVFCGHPHADHIGLLPRLMREGFTGKIIMSHAAAIITKPLLMNSAFIISKESETLSRIYHRNYSPIYSEDDVNSTMNHIYEYDEVYKEYALDDVVSFEWLENSHCIGARQLRLNIVDANGVTKHILYTSDIGSLRTKNHYMANTIIDGRHYDVAILESTYGAPGRMSKKTREFDVEHLRVAINTTLERGGTVVLPAFSFSRSQELMTILYQLYSSSSDDFQIIVDSKLTNEICDRYDELISDDVWAKVREWNRIVYITDKDQSTACVKSHVPKVVISSSGFCTNGRVLSYLHEYLSDDKSTIIFSGYTGSDNSYLSYRIQHYKENKVIKVSGDPVANRADCVNLTTFSSHANREELIEFGSELNTNKLILVHGSSEAKNSLKEDLQKVISKKNKTFRVLASVKDMVVRI